MAENSTATILTLFSGYCSAAAVWREVIVGVPPPKPEIKHLPRVLLVGVNGFLILVSAAALIGIWATTDLSSR